MVRGVVGLDLSEKTEGLLKCVGGDPFVDAGGGGGGGVGLVFWRSF